MRSVAIVILLTVGLAMLVAADNEKIRCIDGQSLIQCDQVSSDGADPNELCTECCKENVAMFSHYKEGNWGYNKESYGLQCCCGTESSGMGYKVREPFIQFSGSDVDEYIK